MLGPDAGGPAARGAPIMATNQEEPVIYLPTSVSQQSLSSWTGRPSGLTIDPIGVEAVPAVPGAGAGAYVHVLVHHELLPERIRSWQRGQLTQHLVRRQVGDGVTSDEFNRATDELAATLADRDWADGTLVVDGVEVAASVWTLSDTLWAVYAELGDARVAVIGSDVPRAAVALRTASADEERILRTEALRV